MSLGDEQFACIADELEGITLRQGVLFRIDLFVDGDFVIRKKLLRPLARRSAGAVIAPVDVAAHVVSPFRLKSI